MIGWLLPEENGGRIRLEPVRLEGLPLLRVSVPLGQKMRRPERRVARAGRLLRERGVRRVLAPAGFAGWAYLAEAGLRPVDPLPLYRALAARLVLALLACRGIPPAGAVVLLRGQRVDCALARAAYALCPRVRTLALSVPEGGARLCRLLREEYGAAVAETLGGARADAVVDFAPGQPPLSGALTLYGAAPDLAGMTLDLPGLRASGLETPPLLRALWEEKGLPLGKIEISAMVRRQFDLTEG